MAGNKCTIAVNSLQTMGSDRDETRETYEGTIMTRDGIRYISYKRETEDGQVKTLISISRDSMTLTQSGVMNSKLTFLPGKRTGNPYSTPMGQLTLDVTTDHYTVIDKSDELQVKLLYRIHAGNPPIKTDMTITVTMDMEAL